MTVTQAAAVEPTLLEQVRALKVTVHALAAERDQARAAEAGAQDAADAIRQELTRARHQVHVADIVNTALQAELDQVRTELRRTRDICRDLAVVKGALELQIDRDQHGHAPQPEPPRKQHRYRPRRRPGNQT
jgi:chromosome segregation ATPase